MGVFLVDWLLGIEWITVCNFFGACPWGRRNKTLDVEALWSKTRGQSAHDYNRDQQAAAPGWRRLDSAPCMPWIHRRHAAADLIRLKDYMHPPDSRQAAAEKTEPQVRWVEVDDGSDGQRLDNFLMRLCKGVPKTHLYKAIRSGEVRVNRGRAQADTRVKSGDQVRIPPLRLPDPGKPVVAPAVEFPVLFEDDHLLVVDKPAGVAVHGGSGVAHGVIEQLRAARPEAKFLELAHRLDRETSGILVLAKRRSTLVALHDDLRQGRWEKRYQALVQGLWGRARDVKHPLLRTVNAAGERQVRVDEQGQYAHTRVKPLRRFEGMTLVECLLKTGRTHQIRVHVASEGHPIAGDERYGDFAWNRELQRIGLRRMFLHAASLQLVHPGSGQRLAVECPLPAACASFLESLTPLPAEAS